MTEILIYTGCGILLYISAEAALRGLESIHGEPIPYRNFVFFFLILTMAIILFQLIGMIFTGDA